MRESLAPEPLAAGVQLQGYRVEAVLAAQRFGFAYLARDAAGRSALLRELLPHEHAQRDGEAVRARDPEDRAALRFWVRSYMRLGAALARLQHPGLARVFAHFEANNTAYHVAEHVGGLTLAARIEQHGPLEQAELQALLGPLLEGLQQAHEAGVLHLDIRPQHIAMRPGGGACLTDFAALRAPLRLKARTLLSGGDPAYAAPEELTGAAVGPLSDLYALAAVLYQGLSGAPPTPAQRRLAGQGFMPTLEVGGVRCSAAFAAAIDAALALDAAARPPSAQAWLASLTQAAANPPALPRAPPAASPPAAHESVPPPPAQESAPPSQAMPAPAPAPALVQAPTAIPLPAGRVPAPARRPARVPLLVYLAGAVVLIAAAAGYWLLRPHGAAEAEPAAAAAGAAEAVPAPAASVATATPVAMPGPPAPPTVVALPPLPPPAAPRRSAGMDADSAVRTAGRPPAPAVPPPAATPPDRAAALFATAAPAAPPVSVATPKAAATPAAVPASAVPAAAPAPVSTPAPAAATVPTPASSSAAAVAMVSPQAAPADPEAEYKRWYRNATGLVRGGLVYPRDALREGQQGEVIVGVTLLHDGTVVAVNLVGPSEFDALNNAAQKAVERLHKFPPLPAGYRADTTAVEVRLPISFKIDE